MSNFTQASRTEPNPESVMKIKLPRSLIAPAMLALLTLTSQLSTAQAQGTAFTYQGRLNNGASPANGSYDMSFSLFGASAGGSQVGSTLTYTAVGVTNGLFTATLDFGAGVFTGANLWLDISVRTSGAGAFTELVPRQPLTPTPYAIMANSASNMLGALPASQLAGTIGLAQLPGAVITNNEAGVTLGSVTISGNLSLPATAALSAGGESFLAGLNVDPNNLNVGAVTANALTFGTSSGEGLASKRSGANAYDLEFWTDFNNRMTISQSGNVGIGTTTAASLLEVNGDVRIDANRLLLEAGGGTGNGLTYASSGLNFVPTGAGAFLFGYNGGALGVSEPNAVALAWDWHGNVWASNNITISAALNIDQLNGNVGTVAANALTFGQNSGEGIGSKRSGTHPYDLEFYTDFNNRMTIANNGNVGINTIAATETLEINGTSRIDDNDMYLRTGTDCNHGLGYRAQVGSTSIDGPLLYGWSGGALGTTGGQGVALRWDDTGSVNVSGTLATAGNLAINGALTVPGAGVGTHTTAFIQMTTSANLEAHGFGPASRIDNPICNGNPNAILIAIFNFSASTSGYFSDPVAVQYWSGYWYIYDAPGNGLPAGYAFNVLVIVP
jgi:hypothetical protein